MYIMLSVFEYRLYNIQNDLWLLISDFLIFLLFLKYQFDIWWNQLIEMLLVFYNI